MMWVECAWFKCRQRFKPGRRSNQSRRAGGAHHEGARHCSRSCQQKAYRLRRDTGSATVTPASEGTTCQRVENIAEMWTKNGHPRPTRCADGVRCRPVIHRVFTGKTGDLVFARRTGLPLAMAARFIVPLALVSMIGPSLATGSPACMTESEARAKFPRAHLIWVGTNHCWTFGAVSVHSRRPVLAAEPVPSPRPAIAAAPSSRPEIDSGGSDITGAQCQYS